MFVAALAGAATNDLSRLLQQGLFEEEANRNLEAASAAYETLVKQFDQDRQLGATAVFRLGEVYRKQGKTNEAVLQYERIIRDFAEQTTLVTLSRQNLAGLDSRPANPGLKPVAADSAPDIAQLKKLSRAELLQVLPTLVPDSLLNTLLAQRNNTQTKLVELKQDVAPDHPEIKRLVAVEKTINEQIDQRVTGILKALELRIDAALPGGMADTAATDGETEIRRIQAMMQNSPDLINAPGAGGFTPLQSAAGAGQLVVARFLLDNGANVNARASDGETALTLATTRGHRAMVELLLARGADINAAGSQGYTALHRAALSGFKAVAEVLLAGKANLQAAARDGQTPLHLAAGAGNLPLIELLLAHGAKVNAVDDQGRTPLLRAVAEGQAAAVKVLLGGGAEPDAQDASGRTALSYATQAQNPAVVKILLAAKANPNVGKLDLPLALAAQKNHREIAELLLEAGADPNLARNFSASVTAPTVNGFQPTRPPGSPYTPLQIAVAKGDAAMVKLLLDHKADANATGAWSSPPAPLTYWTLDKPELLKLFLEAGADANAPTIWAGWSLLTAAANPPRVEAMELLLAHGAKPDVLDSEGKSPLWRVAMGDCLPCVQALLKFKANPNLKTRDGSSALLAAVDRRNKHTVAALIAGGADVNQPDDSGWTPLLGAVFTDSRDILDLLLAKGANPNVRDKDGRTPLALAKAQLSQPRAGLPLPGSVAPLGFKPASPEELVALLRQHGALDELPDFTRIVMRRASANYSATAFATGTNGWNEFTLLELIARQYGFVTTDRNALWEVKPTLPSQFWQAAACPFPDLSRVVIRRADATGSAWQEIAVNVAALLDSGDCARDVKLKPGDIVEIPEADHPINDKWSGLSGGQLSNLLHCVSRTVTISIKGTPTEVQLAPQFKPTNSLGAYGEHYSELARGSFMLKSVLAQSRLLRASSDLSRVKVTRRAGSGGKAQAWVLDCSSGNDPDLWLRDGDVIEVPDKR